MNSTILVLEDQFERIAWLRREFPSRDIKWCENVNKFLDETANPENVDLILLDHDLGFNHDKGYVDPWPKDENGMCGMDAVDQIQDTCKLIPVIVWSINPPRAQEMVARLHDRGFTAVWMPFSDRWRLCRTIADTLEATDVIRARGSV